MRIAKDRRTPRRTSQRTGDVEQVDEQQAERRTGGRCRGPSRAAARRRSRRTIRTATRGDSGHEPRRRPVGRRRVTNGGAAAWRPSAATGSRRRDRPGGLVHRAADYQTWTPGPSLPRRSSPEPRQRWRLVVGPRRRCPATRRSARPIDAWESRRSRRAGLPVAPAGPGGDPPRPRSRSGRRCRSGWPPRASSSTSS